MGNAIITARGDSLVLENGELRCAFGLGDGRLEMGAPGSGGPVIRGARVHADIRRAGTPARALFGGPGLSHTIGAVSDVHGKGRRAVIRCEASQGIALTLTLRIYDGRPFLILDCAIENTGRTPLNLERITLVDALPESGGGVSLAGGARSFFKVGWHDWCYSGLRRADQRDVSSLIKPMIGKMYFNPSTPIPRGKGRFYSEGWGILAGAGHAIVAGFVSTADQFGQVYADCRPGKNAFALMAQADGILMDPGERFDSELGFLQILALPHDEPARDYAEAAARQMNARVPALPPVKWTHWYHYFHNITERLFADNLEVIDGLRDTIPFGIVQLDDGYQSAWGDWYTCNDRFPSGLGALASGVKKKGFTPGLWLAPFVADPRSKLALEHPDWLVKEPSGKPIVSGYFWNFYGNALDATNPEVLAWLRELMATVVKKWGFSFVKTDFTYAAALPGMRRNPKITRARAYRMGMEAIRAGLGKDTLLLGCGSPFGPCIGIVDEMRIGPDTAPNWTPYLWNMKWATPFIKTETGIPALRNNVRHTMNLSALHRRWWWSDPDCLMVRDYDTRLTPAEVRSNVSLIGLTGGLVINSDDLTRLSPAQQRLVALLCPTLSPGGRPVGLLEEEMPAVYDVPVGTKWGAWHAVAVFNWRDRSRRMTLDTISLGIPPGADIYLYDFWNGTGSFEKSGAIDMGEMEPHACRMFRITDISGSPLLVGSSLHITQGCEVASFRARGRAAEIVLADLKRTVEGEIVLLLPSAPKRALLGRTALAPRDMGGGAWAFPVNARGRTVITVTY